MDKRIAKHIPTIVGAIAGTVAYFVLHFVLRLSFGSSSWAGSLLSSPINLATIVAFAVAVSLLIVRWRSIGEEISALGSDLLPESEEALVLPEDALAARKRLTNLPEGNRERFFFRLLGTGLQRARANWSAEDVSDAINREAELIQSDTQGEYSLIRYLIWAIPSLGFIGTVLGIGQAMGAMRIGEESADPMERAVESLSTAFDTTFVALVLSLIVMYLLHRVESEDERTLTRAARSCLARLPRRMYVPQAEKK